MGEKTGVVIGRFQVPVLHEGHIALLAGVLAKHSRMVVLVGYGQAALNAHDPLPVFCRTDAVRAVFPNAVVLPLADMPSDEKWSVQIDHLLKPYGPCVIYGGRDNSLSHYSGVHKTATVQMRDLESTISGTQVREAETLGASVEFRQGMVYAAQKRFPTSYQAVDIAVLREQHVLLGAKPGRDEWFFPGGFVDPADDSLEQAARRELVEECGLFEHSGMRYVGSMRVDDWRYRSSCDKIMTALFTTTYAYGQVQAGDDLSQVAWVPYDNVRNHLAKAHLPLWETMEHEVIRKDQPVARVDGRVKE